MADKQTLTKEQEKQMMQAMHQQMIHSISLPEALKIVASVSMGKLAQEVAEMTEEEKVQTYQALGLK
jgi:DNA-binding TFAR19-related protein (PDSD5 family)